MAHVSNGFDGNFDSESLQIGNLMRVPSVATPDDQAAAQQRMIANDVLGSSQSKEVIAESGSPMTPEETPSPPLSPVEENETEDAVSFDINSHETFPALPSAVPVSGSGTRPALTQRRNLTSRRVCLSTEMLDKRFGSGNDTISFIRSIARSHGCTFDASSSKRITTIILKGIPEKVEKAEFDIIRQTFPKETLSVPAFAVRTIVGVKYRTLQELQRLSGANIEVPRHSARGGKTPSGDKDESSALSVTITISGSPNAIAQAKEEILKVVDRIQSHRDEQIPLNDVPTFLFPLIYGLQNSNMEKIKSETNTIIRYPLSRHQTSDSQDGEPSEESGRNAPEKAANRSDCISVSGSKDQVSVAVERIKNLIEAASNMSEMQWKVDKRLHRYVVGVGRKNIVELHGKYGCVVDVPEASSPSENLKIRGPLDTIADGLKFITGIIQSICLRQVDLLEFVEKEYYMSYLTFITFRKRVEFKRLESHFDVRIRLPPFREATNEEGPYEIEVVAQSIKSAEDSKAEIVSLLTQLGRNASILVPVNQALHHQLRTSKTISLLKDAVLGQSSISGVNIELFLPWEGADPSILTLHLFYGIKDNVAEGDIQKALKSAKSTLLARAHEISNFTSETVKVDPKYQPQLRRLLRDIIEECQRSDTKTKLSITLGTSASNREHRNAREGMEDEDVLIQGNEEDVLRAVRKIKKTWEEIKHYDIMTSNTASVPVPEVYCSRLIGKGGSGIRELESIAGIVKIKIPPTDFGPSPQEAASKDEVLVELKGTKEGIKEAKSRILMQVAEWKDFRREKVKVPQRFVSRVIGKGGKNLKVIEEKYSVRVKSVLPGKGRENGAISTGETLNSEQIPETATLEVTGSKAEVENATKELRTLLEREIEHGHLTTAEVPGIAVPKIMGPKGSRIAKLQEYTGSRIQIGKAIDGSTGDLTVTFEGKEEEIPRAKALVLLLAKFEIEKRNSSLRIAEHVRVPIDLHPMLIGPAGAKIKGLQLAINQELQAKRQNQTPDDRITNTDKFLGNFTAQEADELVRIAKELADDPQSKTQRDHDQPTSQVLAEIRFPLPRREESGESELVTIRGVSKQAVDYAKSRLGAAIAELADRTSIHLKAPASQKASLAGKGGKNLKDITKQFDVYVKLYDSPEAWMKGQERVNGDQLIDLVDQFAQAYKIDRSKVELDIPPNSQYTGEHFAISIQGKPEACQGARNAFVSMVRIVKTHKLPARVRRDVMGNKGATMRRLRRQFDVVVEPPSPPINHQDAKSSLDVDEVWTLKGTVNNVEAAIDEIDEIAEKTLEQTSHWRAVKVAPRQHRLIVGRGGSQLQAIRKQTGCQVVVPPSGSSEEDIIINGPSDEATSAAEEMVLELVENAL